MGALPPVYAHRLGRVPGPDSSRAALAATLAGPVDGLETDVCLTADGRLALLHDPWLARGTTLRGWAHETAWAELATAQLRDAHGVATRETPMLLEELLDAAPGDLVVQVEVKALGDAALAAETAEAVCRLLRRRPDAARVEVLSFHAAAVVAAARRRARGRLVVWADFAPGALAAWARRHDVAGVCVEHFLLDRRHVEVLRDGGLSVTTGTIDDAELALRAAGLGVEAITSDAPAALLAAMAAPLELVA